MPTNVTPEYKKAEEAYRKAREPKERLDCLREMARTIPKHKGTEHLRADIKTRIKQLSEELAGPKKGGRRSGPALVVRADPPLHAVTLVNLVAAAQAQTADIRFQYLAVAE